MTMTPSILVIEDDPVLSSSIAQSLGDFGDVTTSLSGSEGALLAQQGVYDAIVLDIMLPEISGFDLLRDLRQRGNHTPVLILTARDGIADKMHGFENGADDYLTKPFHREELIMRIQALLRRTGGFFTQDALTAGPLRVDTETRSVTANDVPVVLNGKEYDLLVYLLQNQGTIITKAQIFDRLWGFDSETALTVVEVYMSNLRKKLRPSGTADLIKTIRNVGYILQTEVTQ